MHTTSVPAYSMSVSLGWLVICLVVSSDALIRIPVKKSGTLKLHHPVEYLHQINRMNTAFSKTNAQPIDHSNLISGKIGLGTQPQMISVFFETITTDLMVFSKNHGNDCIECANHQKYNHDNSSSYIINGARVSGNYLGQIFYEGFISNDTLQVGGISIKNQPFTELTHIDGIPSVITADGVFGLGLPSSTVSPASLPVPMMNILMQGLGSGVFSFKLKRIINSTDMVTDEELILGGVATELIDQSSLDYVDLTGDDGKWAIKLDRVQLGGVDVACFGGCSAMVTPNVPLILGPSSDVQNILSRLISTVGFNSFEECKFSMFPDLSFIINGKNYSLKGEEYVLKVFDRQYPTSICMAEVVTNENYFNISQSSDEWVLGTIFLAKYYTVFDYQSRRMGFARYSSGSSPLVVFSSMICLGFMVALKFQF